MNITISDGITTITLPGDMYWADEYEWTPIEQSTSYSLSGSLLVETASRLAGRNITLTADSDRAWLTKSVLDQLYAFAAVPGKSMTLTLSDSRVFTVMFRHQDGALRAEPVMLLVPARPDDMYVVTIRLMAI